MPNISQSREGAPSDPSAADVPTAESEKRSAAEEARAIPHDSEPETAASPPEQGRSTLPGLAAETGTESEPAPSGQRREAAASGEKRSAPGPAAPADEEEPDITSGQGEAEVAAEPFLDEVTTRALKRRFPLGVVLAAAAIAAGGLYFWFGTGSASQHQVLPAKAEPHKSASTAAPALAEASTARAPESSSAAEPSEAAPTTAKEEEPTTPEPEAESSLKAKLTQKKSPASQYVAKRAKPKPTSQPEADKPAKVTKSAKAKKARRKRAAGSADSDKMSALDMLRRLDEKGN